MAIQVVSSRVHPTYTSADGYQGVALQFMQFLSILPLHQPIVIKVAEKLWATFRSFRFFDPLSQFFVAHGGPVQVIASSARGGIAEDHK